MLFPRESYLFCLTFTANPCILNHMSEDQFTKLFKYMERQFAEIKSDLEGLPCGDGVRGRVHIEDSTILLIGIRSHSDGPF